jgi:hypothetical protein
MALPASGPLGCASIYSELYGSHSSQACSLRDMSSYAGFTIPDSISEFYGFNKDVSVNFGSWNYLQEDPDWVIVYRPIIRTNQKAFQNISITINYDLYCSPGALAELKYLKNPPSASYITISSISDGDSDYRSFIIKDISSNDDIRIALEVGVWDLTGYAYGIIDIISGDVSVGGGNVNIGSDVQLAESAQL